MKNKHSFAPHAYVSVIVMVALVSGCSQEVQLPQQKTDLPDFTVLKDGTYEDAGTAKVIWVVLVSSEIRQEDLTTLLNDLYLQAQAKRFKLHDAATVIDIKAYTSGQHAEAGTGQWVGWLSKSGGQSEPKLSFNSLHFTQAHTEQELPGEEKFGFTEVKRKAIWEDGVRAEDRSNKEAEMQYPELNPQDRNAYMEAHEKRKELSSQLRKKYLNELAKKHELTRSQLDEIMNEGLLESWPFPN